MIECPCCDGEGAIECWECYGADEYCDVCLGDGWYECDECLGSGVVEED
jgi:hypothetical protein